MPRAYRKVLFLLPVLLSCTGSCLLGNVTSKDNKPLSCLEIPALNPDYTVISHFTSEEGERVRNYTLCYDKESRVPLWVAYPLCDYYTDRKVGRTDEWNYDPEISRNDQPELYRSGNFFANGYERGHQIPSADRTHSYEMNVQTFYFSNIAPMLAATAFNGGLWSKVEDRVRGWSRSRVGTDTLYLVSGCMVDNECRKVKDNRGLEVLVPSAYYKAVLQYSSKYGYRAIGIYLDHRDHSADKDFKQYSMSIDELEALTGIDFFPDLEETLGTIEAERVEASDPLKDEFWWSN